MRSSPKLFVRLAGPLLAQLLGSGAALAQGSEAQGVVAFGQTDAGVVGHQGTVVKLRRLFAEGAVKQELAGGADEQVGAADNFGDAHSDIVHDAGKLIGGNVVIAPDDKVAEVAPRNELLRAAVSVAERDDFAVGYAEAPAEFPIPDFGFSQFPAGAGVKGLFIVGGVGSAGGGQEVFARADAGVNVSGVFEFGQGFAIESITLALIVGGERTAHVRTFLPVETEPAKVF